MQPEDAERFAVDLDLCEVAIDDAIWHMATKHCEVILTVSTEADREFVTGLLRRSKLCLGVLFDESYARDEWSIEILPRRRSVKMWSQGA